MMSDLAAWGATLDAAVCEQCDWRFLLPAGSPPQRCPNCFQTSLTPLASEVNQLPYTNVPELVIPPTVDPETIDQNIRVFARGIPFAPTDLTPQHLSQRLRRLFLPMWLVDSQVTATWQAEAGFDYQVVSHQERYSQNQGQWQTNEVTETRIRWEPRLGRLARTYHNRQAPALEEEAELARRLGAYEVTNSQPYSARLLSQTFVRLPDRSTEDAWSDAEPAFQAAAREECRVAAAADHLRDFRWSPAFQNLHWTQLLRPAYTTYYLDDDRQPQPVLINGQTGRTSGRRRSSMKRAQRTSLYLLGAAGFIFILSLILALIAYFFEPSLLIGVFIGVALFLLTGMAAVVPVFIAWNFNRQQRPQMLGARLSGVR
jgi:hypothetical protein